VDQIPLKYSHSRYQQVRQVLQAQVVQRVLVDPLVATVQMEATGQQDRQGLVGLVVAQDRQGLPDQLVLQDRMVHLVGLLSTMIHHLTLPILRRVLVSLDLTTLALKHLLLFST